MSFMELLKKSFKNFSSTDTYMGQQNTFFFKMKDNSSQAVSANSAREGYETLSRRFPGQVTKKYRVYSAFGIASGEKSL